jgi:hypothetical protein
MYANKFLKGKNVIKKFPFNIEIVATIFLDKNIRLQYFGEFSRFSAV